MAEPTRNPVATSVAQPVPVQDREPLERKIATQSEADAIREACTALKILPEDAVAADVTPETVIIFPKFGGRQTYYRSTRPGPRVNDEEEGRKKLASLGLIKEDKRPKSEKPPTDEEQAALVKANRVPTLADTLAADDAKTGHRSPPTKV